MKQKFYITTTLPYVNAEPHIGFALEIIAADVIARFHSEVLGEEVVFNTGTDEHGQKIHQKAQESGKDTQSYVDEYAAKFSELRELLSINYTHFIRTTNPNHKAAAQEFWTRCKNNGDIYKKMYKLSYCVGCELEKLSSELVDGRCPLHPNKDIEIREEENYFFAFSNYQKALLDHYEQNPSFVEPESKMKEIVAFVSGGLQDFSISRLKEKMPWGVEVPGDPDHVMYVWFDALVNYVSTLGWPDNTENFNAYWPGVQLAGKDNLRQQSAMWQAMLASAGLPFSKKILINGFISIDGQKMSKSLGNVISPKEMVERYGTDATRFLLMRLGPFGSDMDVNWHKLDITYQSLLANNIGNTASRIAKLCENNEVGYNEKVEFWDIKVSEKENEVKISALENAEKNLSIYEIRGALTDIHIYSDTIERQLSIKEPWKLKDENQKAEKKKILQEAIMSIIKLAESLKPFMPKTSNTLISHFSQEKISALEPLFPRLPI
ncbi:MAG: methionine--tRNA ligase [Candidatus Pacebacteria bacterium CG_4_9_14_3_um_filter_40_12]|nr:MAG: methionine--tRNA ligase [Candidatus Pacebacteria bacterium CG10_big_fil_rev_8_21_14_0_10_40_26]PIZ78218.1 MAG: methionine--tRNA ligase [Candidatus Pacebacteria bacterium CG_4_10_14_0_2_um_filter_40_20]PJA68737.1 MAG: methionine--tRNA ligase [Candidatus Pacebacteria bacterium CG_4_9_14_3_um_filter_40_12]PJC41677.1 MAG: methionine--tRNA ligase [Candidatus Pacebacteria bacterium CG_4_9_14_0_2_um_filter_40_15]